MTSEELQDIENTYAAAMFGSSDKPNLVVCPEGAFLSSGEVFDFDNDGNFYLLAKDEQDRRRDILRDKLGL